MRSKCYKKNIKNKKPKSIPKNLIWALDLTGKTDVSKNTFSILGIIEHHSRCIFTLKALPDKSSITILRALLVAIEKFGKPKIIRTDNEAIFTSKLFKFALRFFNIKHQTIEQACPWQNGRIERSFLTLKQKLEQLVVKDLNGLNLALSGFEVWYNRVRPHQNLYGNTPYEVWCGKNIFKIKPTKHQFFSAWPSLLSGYYIPC